MKSLPTPGWPGDLTQARMRFDRWRGSRLRGAPIPERLWRSAAKLAKKHGISMTSRALHLDYYTLKDRMEGNDGKPSASAGAIGTPFIEIPLSPSATGPQCRLELEEGAGSKLRMELRGMSAAELQVLVSAVWRPSR